MVFALLENASRSGTPSCNDSGGFSPAVAVRVHRFHLPYSPCALPSLSVPCKSTEHGLNILSRSLVNLLFKFACPRRA